MDVIPLRTSCDLDLWPRYPKFNRVHLLVMIGRVQDVADRKTKRTRQGGPLVGTRQTVYRTERTVCRDEADSEIIIILCIVQCVIITIIQLFIKGTLHLSNIRWKNYRTFRYCLSHEYNYSYFVVSCIVILSFRIVNE